MNEHTEVGQAIAGAAIKLTPPAGVLGAYVSGWHLPDFAALSAIVYTLLMTAKLLWDWIVGPLWRERAKK